MSSLLVCTPCRRTFAVRSLVGPVHALCTACGEPTCDDCRAPHLRACRERVEEEEEERWAELADEAAHERDLKCWLERGAA